MNKLTQQEASLVIGEAYSFMREQTVKFGVKRARLGQAIHWTASDVSVLPAPVCYKLQKLLDEDCGTEYDFFYFTDSNKVLEVFINDM